MSTQRAVLTGSDLDGFEQQGFIASVQFLQPAQSRRFADQFDELVAREGIDLSAPGYRLNDRHLDQQFIWDVATDPALLDVIAAIAGPDLVLLGSRFICKPPHSALEVPWHRDVTFAGLDPAEQVNVWLAVDDVDTDNGCLRALPKAGAQRAATLAHDPADLREGNLVDQSLTLDDEERAALVALPLAAGHMVVFDGELVHGSESNSSARRRCGLALRYIGGGTKLLNEGQWAAVCVRGEVDDQGGRVVSREGARSFAYRAIDKFGRPE
jgi:hypothetical protein